MLDLYETAEMLRAISRHFHAMRPWSEKTAALRHNMLYRGFNEK